MADDVQFTVAANATPPGGTLASTDETAVGPHTVGSHMGIAKLAVSADGDSTHVPATVADGLLVDLGTNNDVTVSSGTVTINQPVEVIGDVAQSAPVAGNPVLTGVNGSYGLPAGVDADGDSVYAWGDRAGRQIIAQKSFTGTVTSVADNAASTQLLASLATRLGAAITNTSSAALFVKCGTTASLTSFSVRIPQWGYYEVPAGYVGRIDGIWETDPGNGAAVITEFT